MKEKGLADKLVICVPSGNFGNITAGLFGHEMGLPIHRFIAANNANDIFYEYLQTGKYNPQPSKQTIANAMDVGDPSNFARIYDLYKGNHDAIAAYISGATYKDEQIADTMKKCYNETKYVLDPHGACGYQALKEQLKKAGCEERKNLPFQREILEGKLPYTIGGGIGQSRICMFFLKKAHIGEVQASIWPEDVRRAAEKGGLQIL